MWVHYEWLRNGFLSPYKLVLNLSKYLTKFCSINKPIVPIILNVIIVPILAKVSITVIKYHWKTFGEAKVYFSWHFHITVHHDGKSRYQIGRDSRSSNWNKCSGGVLLIGFLPISCSDCFTALLESRARISEMLPPMVNFSFPYQSSIKKLHHRLAHKPIWSMKVLS